MVGGDDDNNEYMMMMKLSICCGLVAQYEVHHNCCLSRSVQPLLSVWLVVVMMVMKLSVCCGLMAQYEVHGHPKCCQTHSVQPSRRGCILPLLLLVVIIMVMSMYTVQDWYSFYNFFFNPQALDLLNSRQTGGSFLATLLPDLDNVLHGGIPAATITEVHN